MPVLTLRLICLPVLIAGMSVVLQAQPAFAYIGPGAGISVLGALWGVLLAIVIAVGGLLYWPLRAMWRRRKARNTGNPTDAEDTVDDGTA